MALLAVNVLGRRHVNQAASNHMTDIIQYGRKIVDEKLECNWESVENREAVRHKLGPLFRRCLYSSVTVCSTRRR